jgi:hypothetical protein
MTSEFFKKHKKSIACTAGVTAVGGAFMGGVACGVAHADGINQAFSDVNHFFNQVGNVFDKTGTFLKNYGTELLVGVGFSFTILCSAIFFYHLGQRHPSSDKGDETNNTNNTKDNT